MSPSTGVRLAAGAATGVSTVTTVSVSVVVSVVEASLQAPKAQDARIATKIFFIKYVWLYSKAKLSCQPQALRCFLAKPLSGKARLRMEAGAEILRQQGVEKDSCSVSLL